MASAAAVVKVRVTGTAAFKCMRSVAAISKPTVCGAPIVPEAAPAETIVFAVSVCTVMPVALPAAATPMVNPERVMVKAVLAGIPATAVVITRDVAPVAPATAVMVATDAVLAPLAVGVTASLKNPEG